jgi:hypothetical protein
LTEHDEYEDGFTDRRRGLEQDFKQGLERGFNGGTHHSAAHLSKRSPSFKPASKHGQDQDHSQPGQHPRATLVRGDFSGDDVGDVVARRAGGPVASAAADSRLAGRSVGASQQLVPRTRTELLALRRELRVAEGSSKLDEKWQRRNGHLAGQGWSVGLEWGSGLRLKLRPGIRVRANLRP